jgi:hypothetical protein
VLAVSIERPRAACIFRNAFIPPLLLYFHATPYCHDPLSPHKEPMLAQETVG